MYLRTGFSYYERGIAAYPGPRVRLRGLRGLGQDDGTDIPTDLPLTPPSVEPLQTEPIPVAPIAPYTPSPSLPGYQASYGTPAAPSIASGVPMMTTAQIASLSTSQPSVVNATYGGMSLSTWALIGFGLIAAAVAFGSGARR